LFQQLDAGLQPGDFGLRPSHTVTVTSTVAVSTTGNKIAN
jgi:hypothetical protein